jgi:hypothetical protein
MTEKRSSDINANEPNNSNNQAVRFSTLAKNYVKFFSQNRFTSAFSLLFATAPTTTATAATRHCKRKKAARLLLPPSGFRYHRSGKPKSLRCSFQSSGMFFIICAMDNPSGSAPFTIASTMSVQTGK